MSCISYLYKKNNNIYCDIFLASDVPLQADWYSVSAVWCTGLHFILRTNVQYLLPTLVCYLYFSLSISQSLKRIVYLILSLCLSVSMTQDWQHVSKWSAVCDLMTDWGRWLSPRLMPHTQSCHSQVTFVTHMHVFSHTSLNSKQCFWALEGHFRKRTSFVGAFKMEVNNRILLQRALPHVC